MRYKILRDAAAGTIRFVFSATDGNRRLVPDDMRKLTEARRLLLQDINRVNSVAASTEPSGQCCSLVVRLRPGYRTLPREAATLLGLPHKAE